MIPDYILDTIVNPYLPNQLSASPLNHVQLSSYYDTTVHGEYSAGRDHDFIGWKQAYILCHACGYTMRKPVVVKLTIPKDAEVVFTDSKCRASYVKVEAIYPAVHFFDEENIRPLDAPHAFSFHNRSFKYVPGAVLFPDEFDRNPNAVCSHGIHFFRHYGEAYDY